MYSKSYSTLLIVTALEHKGLKWEKANEGGGSEIILFVGSVLGVQSGAGIIGFPQNVCGFSPQRKAVGKTVFRAKYRFNLIDKAGAFINVIPHIK